MLVTELNSSMDGRLTDDMITVNKTILPPVPVGSASLEDIVEEVDVTSGSSYLTIGDTRYEVQQCLGPVECQVFEYAGELNSSYFYQLSNATEFVTSDFMTCPGKLCLIQRFAELTQLLFQENIVTTITPITLPMNTFNVELPPIELAPPTRTTSRTSCTCDLSLEALCCSGTDYTNGCLAECAGFDIDDDCTQGTCSGEPSEAMDMGSVMENMLESMLSGMMGGRKLTSVEECTEKLDSCCTEYKVKRKESICEIASKNGVECEVLKLYNGVDSVEAGDIIQIC
eukprot:TRINITY_DN7517_c0_g2_i1.p1 TRINITY_DN7517_c0_g2~~TRINITY_DN7517_c0_g2_i1.p1  ORF type:complete len:285 (+),score=40.04 TRINITY_DN7517_c0_g2_i1:3-857(+)